MDKSRPLTLSLSSSVIQNFTRTTHPPTKATQERIQVKKQKQEKLDKQNIFKSKKFLSRGVSDPFLASSQSTPSFGTPLSSNDIDSPYQSASVEGDNLFQSIHPVCSATPVTATTPLSWTSSVVVAHNTNGTASRVRGEKRIFSSENTTVRDFILSSSPITKYEIPTFPPFKKSSGKNFAHLHSIPSTTGNVTKAGESVVVTRVLEGQPHLISPVAIISNVKTSPKAVFDLTSSPSSSFSPYQNRKDQHIDKSNEKNFVVAEKSTNISRKDTPHLLLKDTPHLLLKDTPRLQVLDGNSQNQLLVKPVERNLGTNYTNNDLPRLKVLNGNTSPAYKKVVIQKFSNVSTGAKINQNTMGPVRLINSVPTTKITARTISSQQSAVETVKYSQSITSVNLTQHTGLTIQTNKLPSNIQGQCGLNQETVNCKNKNKSPVKLSLLGFNEKTSSSKNTNLKQVATNTVPVLFIQSPVASQGVNQPLISRDQLKFNTAQLQTAKIITSTSPTGAQVLKLIPVSLTTGQAEAQNIAVTSEMSPHDIQKLLVNVLKVKQSTSSAITTNQILLRLNPTTTTICKSLTKTTQAPTTQVVSSVEANTKATASSTMNVSSSDSSVTRGIKKLFQSRSNNKIKVSRLGSTTPGGYIIKNGSSIRKFSKPYLTTPQLDGISVTIKDSKVVETKLNFPEKHVNQNLAKKMSMTLSLPAVVSPTATLATPSLNIPSKSPLFQSTSFQSPEFAKAEAEYALNRVVNAKFLQPINMSGSARTSGLKPYQRVDTFIYQSENSLISNSNDGSHYPVIADYKSLAPTSTVPNAISSGPVSTNETYLDSISRKNTAWKSTWSNKRVRYTVDTVNTDTSEESVTVVTPVISNVFSYANLKSEPKTVTDDIYSSIHLPVDSPNKENIKEEWMSSNHVKDTVGIVRTDVSTIEQQTRTQTVETNLVNCAKKTSRNVKKSSNKRTSRTSSKEPDFDKPAKRTKLLIDLPALENTEAPTSFAKISRTFFALDRLRRSRSFLVQVGTLDRCLESLYALRNKLVTERSRHKLFMDENLLKWQNAALARKGLPVEVKDTKSPAQRLLEKFSLKSCTSPAVDGKKPIPIKKSPLVENKKEKTFKKSFDEQKCKFQKEKSNHIVAPQVPTTQKSIRERPSFNDILAEQRRKKRLRNEISSSPVNNENVKYSKLEQPNASKQPVASKQHIVSKQSTVSKQTTVSKKHTSSKQPIVSKLSSPKKQRLTTSESSTPKINDVATISSRNRLVSRKFSNPKDPYNSSEDRALQMALALSLKTMNEEKRRQTDDPTNSVENDEKKSRKKKRPTEIDQLVDTHWNESWLKDSPSPVDGRPDVTSPSIREERALHYAMVRFAEMEHEKGRTDAVKSPTGKREDLKINVEANATKAKIRGSFKQDGNKHRKNKSISTTDKEDILKKKAPKNMCNSKKKERELVHRARQNFKKAQKKKQASCVTPSSTISSTASNVWSQVSSTSANKISPKTVSAPVQKKEYLLVPKYHGFKDFTPIVVDSRTRRQASSEDRNRLKRRYFPLVVVEKIGNKTKEVVVQEGENKEKKLAQVSNSARKQFASLSKHNRYLSVNRNTGETVLHKAARLGYRDLAELRIHEGADIHIKDNAGWSALHEACAHSKYDVVKVLLKYGADPNCCSNSGVRPLHDAVEKRDIRVIRLLLAYGGDPSISSYTGALPIDIAKTTQVRNFLREHMESVTGLEPKRNSNNNELGWKFQGSCDILDKNDCNGIFDDLPEDDNPPFFEFEMGNRAMLPSYYLPFSNEHDVVLGYRNYFLLSDILERLNIARNTLLKHHKFEIRQLEYDKFVEYVQQSSLSHVPDVPSCSTKDEEFVELVSMGAYTLRKLMNMKLFKVS